MKKSIKITLLGIAFFAIIALFCKSEAASASISASSTSVNVGDTVTIKVNINAAAWDLKVTGAVSGGYADTTDDGNNKSRTETLTFKPSSAGTFKVSLSGNVTDGSTNATSNVSGSVSITASVKATPTPTPTAAKTTPTPTKATATPTPTKAAATPTPASEEKFTTVNETVVPTTGGINVRKSNSTSSDSLGKLKEGEEVTRIAVGTEWSKIKYNGGTGYVRNDMLTVKKTDDKTSDKSLKSLIVDGYELTPVFNSETTEYDIVVDEKIEKLDVKATANDEKAKVTITGNDKISDTNSLIKVTVTAQDGTTRLYKINVTKQAQSDALGLLVLRASGLSLDPSFRSDVYEYKIKLNDASKTKLDLVATANKSDSEVIIKGNENLQAGDNVITITVKSKDGTESVEYKITVTKQTTVVAGTTGNGTGTTKKSNDSVVYVGIIVAVFIGVMAIIIIGAKKNKKDVLDEAELSFEEDDDSEDDLYGSLGPDASLYGNNYGATSPAYTTFDIAKEYGDESDNVGNSYGYNTYSQNSEPAQSKKDSIINKYFNDDVATNDTAYQMDSINTYQDNSYGNKDTVYGTWGSSYKADSIYGGISNDYEEEEHIGFGNSSNGNIGFNTNTNDNYMNNMSTFDASYDKLFNDYKENNLSSTNSKESIYAKDDDIEVDLDSIEDEVIDESEVNLDFSNSIQDAISSYESNVGNDSSVYTKFDNVGTSGSDSNVFGSVGMNFESVFDKKDEVQTEGVKLNTSKNYEDDFEALFNSKFNSSMQSSMEKSYKSIYDEEGATPFDQGLQVIDNEEEGTTRRARGRHSK